MSKTEPHENPLVPNKRLRELYAAMVSVRVLDGHLKARVANGRKLHSTRGEEACRAGTAIDLHLGDLVSDTHPAIELDPRAGAKRESLSRRIDEKSRINGKSTQGKHARDESSRPLPWIKNDSERLRLAMGAALSLKMRKQPNLVLAYTQAETRKREWRKILEIASGLELPIVFVVLPSRVAGGRNRRKMGSTLGTSLGGVPVITVDASDAVALYRVAQEAFGRIRGGGGPVLVACAAFLPEGARPATPADPVLKMRDFLREKSIATQAWLDKAGDGVRRRTDAADVPRSVPAGREEKAR